MIYRYSKLITDDIYRWHYRAGKQFSQNELRTAGKNNEADMNLTVLDCIASCRQEYEYSTEDPLQF